MAPILGIWASQISGHLFAPSGAYDSIATTTVGAGGTASITFSSIPSTYTHLQIRALVKHVDSPAYGACLNFNSDTSSNYSFHYLLGNGSAASAGASANDTTAVLSQTPGSGAGSNIFGVFVIDILDYKDTNKYKTVRSLGGYDANGSGIVNLYSGSWRSTSAVTSISLTTNNDNWVQYSSFALYGIKGN
jgi:hypothetical protein